MSVQYDRYNFVYIKDAVTIVENDNHEVQTHYFHLGSVCRISRAYEDKTVIYFDNRSFIIVQMNDQINHAFTTKWATAVFESGKYKVKSSSQSPVPVQVPVQGQAGPDRTGPAPHSSSPWTGFQHDNASS